MAKRLVVIGHVKAGKTRTIDLRYDSSRVKTLGLIDWNPVFPEERFPKPDHDLIRKQRIEDGLARGDDL